RPFRRFLDELRTSGSLAEALFVADAPPHVRRFVHGTLRCVELGSTEEVAGAFFFGREGQAHGPAAARIVDTIVGSDPVRPPGGGAPGRPRGPRGPRPLLRRHARHVPVPRRPGRVTSFTVDNLCARSRRAARAGGGFGPRSVGVEPDPRPRLAPRASSWPAAA